MINTKSKKWTVALVLLASVLTLALSLGIVSQSVNESSQLNADGAVPTEILGIVAVDEYTLADGYWRVDNKDGTYGDYAFYQGMTVDAALARIKGVKVKLDNDKEDVLPIGDPADDSSFTYKVTVTTTTSTGNNSTDNVAVPFAAEVVVDETTTLTSDCEVNFIAVKPYALEWVTPLSTAGKGLTTDMDITSSLSVLGLQDSQIRFRRTDGQPGDTILVQFLKTEDTLTPSGEKMKTLQEGDKYTKDISIYYAPRIDGQQTIDRSIQPLKFTVEDIAYAFPTGVGKIISSNTAQMAGSPFNFEGYKLNIEYRNGRYTSEEFLTALDCVTNITFYDSRDAELGQGKEFHLTTAVRSAYIEYAIQGKNGLLTGGSYVNFSVNQQPISQPTVSDLNPTYKDGGVTVTIGAIEKDDVGTVTYKLNTTDTSAAVLAEDNSSITFYKGGTYILSIILKLGEDGNYLWNTGVADRKGNYQIDYTITVSNAPVDVTLTYAGNKADREYGDDEPARTVALSYAGGGSQISGGLTQGSAADNPNDTDEPEYELRYYGGGLTLDQTDSVTGQAYTTKRPTALGTYSVYAATGETDKYAAGRSSSVEFTIRARELEASSLAKSIPYDEKAHTVDEFVNVGATRTDGKPMFVNGDTVTSVIDIPKDTFTHVTDTTIALTITNNNYVWSSESKTENVRIQITKVDTLSFTVTRDDLTYGQTIANKPESFDSTGLRFGVTVDTANPVYEHTVNGLVWTTINLKDQPITAVWKAGRYRVTYKTVDKKNEDGTIIGTGGDKATDDYNLPTVTEEFIINKKQQTAIELTSNHMSSWYEWSSSVNNEVWLTQYGNTLTTTLNYYPDKNVIAADVGKDPETETVNKIVTYRVELTPHAGASTVVVSSATAAGSFDLTLAGRYDVYISLNENYIWSDDVGKETETRTRHFCGDIDRAILSDFSLTDGITYDGADHDVNVKFSVNHGTAAWAKDFYADEDGNYANVISIDSITGSKHAAEELAKSITPNTDEGVQNGAFTVKYAGEYAVELSINDTNNYKYSSDDVLSTLTYTVNQALFSGTWDYTGPYPFNSGAEEQSTPGFRMNKIANNETALADVNSITPVFTLYDEDFAELTPQKVTKAGTFYKVVTSLTSTDNSYSHLNYEVPKEDKDTQDRKVSVVFVVSSAGLDKIVLQEIEGLTGLTINGNAISFVYDHSEHKLSDFITDYESKYCLKKDGVIVTPYLDITVEGVTGQNPVLKNVKLDGEAVAAYTFTVKPATNYKWKEDQGLTETEEVTFTVTINQLAVEINWQNRSKDYGDSATTTVEIKNRENDDVNVTYVYEKDGTEYTSETIRTANAEKYTLVAKLLEGDDKDNYTLTNCTYTDEKGNEYYVYKKGIAKPSTSFNAANPVGTYGDGNTASLYSNQGELESGLFSVYISGKYPAEWFDNTESDKIFTVDASVFDKETGVFAYVHAGHYNFTFSINNTINYCWSDAYETEKDNFGHFSYQRSWNDLIVVNRKPIVAPALGEYRAMEWDKGVSVLDEVVFTGEKDGVKYSTQYAAFISVGNYDIFSDEQAGGTGDKANITRGKYVARLTVAGDNANDYEWEFDINDKIGNYVDSPGYEKVNAQNGAIIYLFYTITASQLPVSYEVVNTVGGYAYVFGQNGYAIGNAVISEEDRVNPTDVLHMTSNNSDDITIAKTGKISYTFTAHEDNASLTVLDVNGLPWYAGKYYVTVKIDFTGTKYADVYSELNISRDKDGNALVLVVAPREIEVKWTAGVNEGLSVDGTTITKTYNGNGELPVAIVTNMPKKSADDDTAAPALTLNLTENDVINASTGYTLTATLGENEKNFVNCDASARQATLVVNKAALSIRGVGTTHVYGDSLDYLNGDNYKTYYATGDTIYPHDGKVIKITVTDGTNVITSNLGAVVGGTYYVVPTLDATVPGSANYELNFAGNGDGNKFTVEKRQISVAVDYKSATSVYGMTPIDINVTPSIYTVDVHNGLKVSGLPAGVSASDVFTFAVKDGSNAINNLTDVGMYDITCALTDAASANYELDYYAGLDLPQYEITKANITAIKVTPYTGVYNADYYNILSTNTASVVNDSLSQNALVWQWSTNGTTWNEYTVTDGVASERVRDVSDSKTYYIKVSAGKNFVESDSIAVNVAISKAPLTVSVNMAIHFGEHGPDKMGNGGMWYNQSITALRKSGGIYTVEGLLKDDRTLFYDLSDDFYSLNSNLFSYSYKSGEEYTRGKNVGTYTLVFDPNGLECGNYTFAGKNGALTVEKLPVTVTLVEDVMTAVYGTHPELLAVNSKYIESVTTQEKSFYNNSNTIDLDGMVLSDFISLIRTTALDDSNTIPETADVGKYPIIVTLVNENCYWETAAPTTQYEITQATNVITTEGYELFVTQGLSTTDSGNVPTAWTYGDVSSVHTNGYAPNGIHALSTLALLYSGSPLTITITRGSGDSAVSISDTAFDPKNGSKSATDVLKALFAQMHAATGNTGLYAGDYVVTYEMGNSTNYKPFSETWYFKVAKQSLRITPANLSVMYGEDLTTAKVTDANQEGIIAATSSNLYPYFVSGLVAHNGNGTLDSLSDIIEITFKSDYVAGFENGSVKNGGYAITVVFGDSKELRDNYYVSDPGTSNASTVTVTPRPITIQIDSTLFNAFNLYTYENGSYVEETAKTYRFTLTDGTFAAGDYTTEVVKDGNSVEYTVQSVFTLASAAFDNSAEDLGAKYNTNHAGKYPIYMLKGDHYGNDGANYSITITDTQYVGNENITTVPTDDPLFVNTNGIYGTFTINKAKLNLTIVGPYKNSVSDDNLYAADSAERITYDANYKVFDVQREAAYANLPYEVNYYKGTVVSQDNQLTAAPIDVGTYTIECVVKNDDYEAASSTVTHTIIPRSINVIGGIIEDKVFQGKDFTDKVTFNSLLNGAQLSENIIVQVVSAVGTPAVSGAPVTFGEFAIPGENSLAITARNAGTYTVRVRLADDTESNFKASNYRFIKTDTTDKWTLNDDGSATFTRVITQAYLTVNIKDVNIQYGAALSGDSLFAGFTPKYTMSFQQGSSVNDTDAAAIISSEKGSKFFDERGLSYSTANTDGGDKYKNTDIVGTNYNVTPAGLVAYNFNITYGNSGLLTVVKRNLHIKISGYGDKANHATTQYIGQRDPLAGVDVVAKGYLDVASGYNLVNGNKPADLGITLSVDGKFVGNVATYNATGAANPYTISWKITDNAVNANYNITFVRADGTVIDNNVDATKPTYVITKAPLTITPVAQTVTYGYDLDNFFITDRQTDSDGKTYVIRDWSNNQTRSFVNFSGFVNGENYDSMGANIGSSNKFKFTTNYAPYTSHVGDSITISLEGSVLEFTNYDVTLETANITVTPRTISAEVTNEAYGVKGAEVYGEDGSNYHDGIYGKAHEATIAFSGHGNNAYVPQYAPLTYNTNANASWNQTAGAAPTRVGEYVVTVTLKQNKNGAGNYDYVFANNAKAAELGFNVVQKKLNAVWAQTSINSSPETGTADLNNSVTGYVHAIMFVSRFDKNIGGTSTSLSPWTDGDKTDKYIADGEGLRILASNQGTYTVVLELRATAQHNYCWDGDTADKTCVFYVTTSKVTILNFDWDSWTYGEDKYGPKEIVVDNNDAAGVTYRFAAVPQGFTGELSELSYNMGAIPVNAGHYAAQATYPTVGNVGGDVKYSAFEIYKAPIAVPTVSGTVFTYNGATQSSDPITVAKTEEGIAIVIIQSYSQNALSCIVTESGVVISAVNAGSYDITFALASSNYTWADSDTDTNSVRTVNWTIGKANDNKIALNRLNDVRYGTPYSVTATSAYGGVIPANNVYFAKSDSKPLSDSALWTTTQPTGRGTYYVKVVAQGTVNYETVELISEWSFEITKATLTVTPTGSMVYGDAFTATSDKYSWTVTSGLVGNDKDDVVRVIGSGVTYKTVGNPTLNAGSYGFELVSDGGFVVGLEADNYDIVSGTGTLRVTARPLTVTIGATSSEYGMPIVLDKDALLTYSETVIAGNNLNIELSTTASPAQDGTPKSVGGYVITATYNCANYDVTFVTGAYTITQRQVIVGFADGLGGEYGSVTYADDEGYDCTVTVKNGEGSYTADEIGLTLTYLGLANSGHTFEGRPTEAGSYNISASCTNANFAIVDTPAHQFVISKKVIDGSKLSFASIEYTGELVTPQITDNDYNVGGAEIYSVETRTDLINVNTYSIALTLKDPFNYKWASVEVAAREVPFEITKATLKVTPNGTMTYGQQFNQAAFNYVVDESGLLGRDAGKSVNSIVRANINVIEYKLVTEVSGLLTVKDGGYELTMETDGDNNVLGLEANNYNIVLSDAYGTLTVNKREIALQVIDSTSVYGEEATLSDTYRVLSGSVVDGDDLGFVPVRDDASNLNQGTYTVSATISNNNYLATEIRNGTHTIVRLRVAVSIRAQDGVYGVTPATVRVMEVVTTNATGTQHSVPVDSLTYVYSYTGVVNGSSVSETFTAMPTNAGRYTARLTALDNDNYELDTTQGILTSMFLVNAKEINADKLQINSPRYTGSAQKPQVTVPEEFRDMFYDNGVLVYEQDDSEFTVVGRHTFVLTLKAEYANNYKWASSDVATRNVDFVIIKAQNGLVDDKIDVPAWVYGNVTDNPQAEAVSGSEAKVTFEYSEDGINYTDRIPTAAGDYYVRAVIEATDNYEAYTSAPKKFTIEQAAIEVLPTINVITEGIEKNDVYTGGQLVSTIDGFNTKVMDMPKVDNNDPNVIVRVSGGSVMLLAANAGTYTIRFPLLDADNYKWNDIEGATIENNEVVLRWTINKQKVAVPDREGKTFFVTGNDMTFIPEGYNPAIMTIEGNVSGYSGTFKAVISLKDPSNYEWADSDLVGSDIEIEWKIIGVNIVFVIIISVIASACITLAITAGILYARKRSKVRAEARAIDRRSKADGWTGEPEDQDAAQNNNGDEGGND